MQERRIPPYTDFCFIHAKIRGMRSFLFERERLLELIQSRDLTDLYRRVFPSGDFPDLLSFQKRLIFAHISQLRRISLFFREKERKLIEWHILRFALENLKVVLRGWLQKSKEEEISPLLAGDSFFSELLLKDLLSAPSARDFVERIPWKEFREGASRGLPLFSETGKPFFLESGMDCAYYKHMEEQAGRTLSKSHRSAIALILQEREMYNLLTFFRARFHYDLDARHFGPFLVPDDRVLAKGWMSLARKGQSLEEALTHLPRSMTGPWAPFLGKDLGELENLLWSNFYRKANHEFYFSFLNMGSILAFLYIKRIELANLMRVSEGIRYRLPAVQIQKELIPVPLSGPRGPA